MGRAAAVWVVLVGLLAALSSSGASSGPSLWAPWLAVVVAVVVGAGARTSLMLGALRAGTVGVASTGARHVTPLLAGLVAGGLALAAARVVAVVQDGVGIAVGGVLGLLVAFSLPRPLALRPTSTTQPVFLMGGALVAAAMAAALGAVVGLGRFGLEGEVPPGTFSQVLAGTLLCDALLGLGGFVRASTSLQRGLVVAPPRSLPAAPGPVLMALLLAAPTVLVLPSLLPPVAASTAVVTKVVVGALVGGCLHLAGGLRGARFAAGAV